MYRLPRHGADGATPAMPPESLEPSVPPAVIGFLLLLAVVLAIVFIVAAQVVQTP